MNMLLNFFHDIIMGSTQTEKPVGLSSFKETKTGKPVIKHSTTKGEVKISDLMRRTH